MKLQMSHCPQGPLSAAQVRIMSSGDIEDDWKYSNLDANARTGTVQSPGAFSRTLDSNVSTSTSPMQKKKDKRGKKKTIIKRIYVRILKQPTSTLEKKQMFTQGQTKSDKGARRSAPGTERRKKKKKKTLEERTCGGCWGWMGRGGKVEGKCRRAGVCEGRAPSSSFLNCGRDPAQRLQRWSHLSHVSHPRRLIWT